MARVEGDADAAAAAPGGGLLGRDEALATVDALLGGVPDRGGALLVRGEPGIGKSALLAEVGRRARARGLRVLTTTGVETEAHLPYASLLHLVRPSGTEVARLPAPQRAALEAALGGAEGEDRPTAMLVSLATLTLLAERAAAEPLLLLVEDAQWLDGASCAVLAFVARRVTLEPVVVVFSAREGMQARVAEDGIPHLRLTPLGGADAGRLLDGYAPGLPTGVRERVLDEARGNPLALVELAEAVRTGPPDGRHEPGRPASLPLTDRLERAFASRLPGLPGRTRALLTVAALDDGADVRAVLTAATSVAGEPVTVDDLAPGVDAHLVDLDPEGLRFRHPLVRSAVAQSAPAPTRQAAHAALASAHAADPDRSVWHRAAAALGPDPAVSAALEEAAGRALARGAPAVAEQALERAARLASDPTRRGLLLLRSAETALQRGRRDHGLALLGEAEPLPVGPAARTRLTYLREMFGHPAWSGAARIPAFVAIAERLHQDGDVEQALEALLTVALRCWWSNPDADTRALVVAAADRLPLPAGHPARLAVLALGDPVARGATVLTHLGRLTPDDVDDPAVLSVVGAAASAVWAPDLSVGFLDRGVDGLRAQGRLGLLVHALVSRAWTGVHLANAAVALPAASEAARLAVETGQTRWAEAARLAEAAVAAERGDGALATRLADEAERVLLPMGANPMLALVQLARGRAALAEGRHGDAYEQLGRVADPDDVAFHPYVRAWLVADLAEAGVAAGRADEARLLVDTLGPVAEATPGGLLVAGLGRARAVLADDGTAEAAYADALAGETGRFPSHRARLLLAYGTRLRRARRVADSRAPLRAARESFDALGFRPWAERARRELRASGETSRARTPEAWDRLSPQELQIAQMAGAGLTNREIGERLYLSHRTVGSHLYRIFPKLGVTSRAQLREVLDGAPDPGPASPDGRTTGTTAVI